MPLDRFMLHRAVRCVASELGVDIRRTIPARIRRRQLRRQPPAGARIYVGCGNDRRPGYIGCDIRPLPTADLRCAAWEVSTYVREAAEIYARHMVEHLTWAEAECTFSDWYAALAVGGKIHIVVPNLPAHIEQWSRAVWNRDELADTRSNARWGFAGLYGWQRECDPRGPGYRGDYWDVHKSGYDAELITFLLQQAGFSDVQTEIEDGLHLSARAVKRVAVGERQVAPDAAGIRADHRGRYSFAARHVPAGARVLDAACGVGYGTGMLADLGVTESVLGVDLDEGAITYAEEHYAKPKARFERADLQQRTWSEGSYDVVVSFETLEHLPNPHVFLRLVHHGLKPNGLLICSTPNELRMPFDVVRFPHHVRHYSPDEFEQLLTSCGFAVERRYAQSDPDSDRVDPGWEGGFLLAVCRAVEGPAQDS